MTLVRLSALTRSRIPWAVSEQFFTLVWSIFCCSCCKRSCSRVVLLSEVLGWQAASSMMTGMIDQLLRQFMTVAESKSAYGFLVCAFGFGPRLFGFLTACFLYASIRAFKTPCGTASNLSSVRVKASYSGFGFARSTTTMIHERAEFQNGHSLCRRLKILAAAVDDQW